MAPGTRGWCRRWRGAAIAAGADGLLIEVHTDPAAAHERRPAVPDAGRVRRADALDRHDRGGRGPLRRISHRFRSRTNEGRRRAAVLVASLGTTSGRRGRNRGVVSGTSTPKDSPGYRFLETDSRRRPSGSRIDELVFARLKQLGIEPAAPLLRRGLRPPRLPRRHRHAAHRPGSHARSSPTRRPGQARRADRPPARARGVRRLLGDEVVRPAAGQGGVPDQPLAQRRAGLSPLDPRPRSARTCRTTSSPASC